jgi:hypothetical protein
MTRPLQEGIVRVLPHQITRFNYWKFFRPDGLDIVTTLKQHIQQTFLHDLPDRPFSALKDYVIDEKEWSSNKTAQEIRRHLPPQQRQAIDCLDMATWPKRSKRPARIKRTWNSLLNEIAQDQALFEHYCDTAPQADEMSGTKKRIYLSYRNQAIELLGGGGTYIPLERRSRYQVPSPLDESDNPKLTTLLNSRGRIDIPSVFPVNWLKLARQERQEEEKKTLHWFHHALRNLRECRNRRPPIPWTAECEYTCRTIHKKLLTIKS